MTLFSFHPKFRTAILWFCLTCCGNSSAFTPIPIFSAAPQSITTVNIFNTKDTSAYTPSKTNFINSLDLPYDLNERSETRTQLLNDMLAGDGSFANPGRQETFQAAAPGVWRVVYAPHMTIMAGLAKGELSVEYDMRKDGTLTSHAKYNFPLFNLRGYLSVSGTYGSVNESVCRVDFDEAWIRTFGDDSSFEQGPFPDITSVPNSPVKSFIRNVGRSFFIEPFAVFPVSYLDNDIIVFDFELLGTRICARKE